MEIESRSSILRALLAAHQDDGLTRAHRYIWRTPDGREKLAGRPLPAVVVDSVRGPRLVRRA